MRNVITMIASAVAARANCAEFGGPRKEAFDRWTEQLEAIDLPSGSGFDNGSSVDIGQSTEDRIVLSTSFHHMTEGTYDGWTDHEIIVTPSLVHGYDVEVTGEDRNDILEYIADVFSEALGEDEAPPMRMGGRNAQ